MKIHRKKYTISSAFTAVYKPAFFLLVVAVLISNSNYIYDSYSSLGDSAFLFLIFLGVIVGVSSGITIESKLRNYFSEKWIKGLSGYNETSDIEQVIQLCSRDLTTSFERLSWYIHDILWVLSMLFVSLFAMFVSFGFIGIFFAILFLSIFIVLYKKTIENIVRTRRDSIEGFNSLIISSYNSIRVKKMNFIDGFLVERTIDNAISTPISHFHDTRREMIKSKSLVGIHCEVLGDLVILISIFLGIIMNVSIQSLLVVVTPLILIKGSLINVFFAVTGFKSNSISADRIIDFSRVKERVEIKYHNKVFYIPAFSSFISYNDLALDEGRIYQLSADSGAGKTTYLKTVSNIRSPSQLYDTKAFDDEVCTRTIYLNESVQYYSPGQQSAQVFLRKFINSLRNDCEPIIISLDECLGEMGITEAKEFLSETLEKIKGKRIAIIFSDHRFIFGEKIRWDDMVNHD